MGLYIMTLFFKSKKMLVDLFEVLKGVSKTYFSNHFSWSKTDDSDTEVCNNRQFCS